MMNFCIKKYFTQLLTIINNSMENNNLEHQNLENPTTATTTTKKKQPRWKKILKWSGISFVILLAIGIAIPFLFKEKILAVVKKEVNKGINAKIEFSDVSLSLFRHFPKFSVRLENLKITGIGNFEGIELLNTAGLDLNLDLMSVINGGHPYKVISIDLQKPKLHIIRTADGLANYDITKPAAADTEPSEFNLNLESYSISDGHIIFDDKGLDAYLELPNLSHSGSGEMSTDLFDLRTYTESSKATIRYGNLYSLSNATAKLDFTVNMDMKKMKFTLKNNQLILNDMQVKADGWLEMPPSRPADMVMDIKFSAPQNNFKNLLSIVPGIYTEKFKEAQASGQFAFDGFVKGTMNETALPSFGLNLKVDNGALKYPALPLGISNVGVQMALMSPSSNMDDLKLDIPSFALKVGSNPISGNFFLRTPKSDPDVDTKVNGTLNLAELAQALPMESVQSLNGVLVANLAIKTRMSAIDKKAYDQINMIGGFQLDNMTMQPKGQPAVKIQHLQMDFTPNNVRVGNFVANIGKSDIQASGTLDNILAYFKPDRTLTGNFIFRSNLLDVNEFITPTPPTEGGQKMTNASPTPPEPTRPFDRFNFTLDAQANKIIYDKYNLTGLTAKGNFTPNKFVLSDFKTNIGNSDIAGSGTLVGVFDYLFDNRMLGGEVNVTANYFDLNQFMTATPPPSVPAQSAATQIPATPTEPFLVPKNVNLKMSGKMNRITYTNMDLRNVVGNIVIANQEVRIENASANAFDGSMGIKGGYNTQNPAKPTYNLSFDMKSVDFQKSFNTFNTFQKAAPIGNYVKGKYSTLMSFNGELGKDMTPNMQTLNAEGLFQTLSGVISGFKPLEEVGNRLNMPELKSLDLKDTKNWFEIKNGAFLVREFDKKVKDIGLKIGGSHSFTNEMNYTIKARVPRKYLQSNAAGAAAGATFDNLLKEAGKYGVNIQNSEFVNVQFTFTGSMLAPKVAMKFLSGEGKGTSEVAKEAADAALKRAEDSLRNRANQELDKMKEKAKSAAERAADSLANVAKRKAEEAKEKAAEEIRKRAGEQIGKETQKKLEEQMDKVGGDKIKQQTDKLKDKLDKFDPFKKKTPPPQEPKQ
jgi:hypothetical protein